MIKDILLKRKTSISDKWIQAIFDSYPFATSVFLKRQDNKFANPVGAIITENAEKIVDAIVNNHDSEIKSLLENIIKIRAVQEFEPSKAMGFICQLKEIIIEELEQEIKLKNYFEEFLELENRIDGTSLVAFDIYMEDKEKIFQIKINEVKNKMFTKN